MPFWCMALLEKNAALSEHFAATMCIILLTSSMGHRIRARLITFIQHSYRLRKVTTSESNERDQVNSVNPKRCMVDVLSNFEITAEKYRPDRHAHDSALHDCLSTSPSHIAIASDLTLEQDTVIPLLPNVKTKVCRSAAQQTLASAPGTQGAATDKDASCSGAASVLKWILFRSILTMVQREYPVQSGTTMV